MESFFTFLVAAAFILGNAANATAQAVSKPVVIGEELTLYSSVLKEERVLFISKPLNYETSTERYPVLFVLDGEAHFHHTTATTRFLASNQFAPEMLVVAIGNTDRTRDLTPPSQDPAAARTAPTHLAKGRTEKAVEVYQLALKAEPGNDAAKQALSKLGIEFSNPATR